MDRLKSMEIFIAVADAGSFAGAADRLSLARSTVTRAVKDLEAHLGAALVQRTSRRFALTTDGAQYLERTRYLVREITEAEARIGTDSNRVRGTVRVNTTPSIARHLLVPALPDFHDRFPDVKIRVSTSDRLVDVVGGGHDCVIRAGQPDDSASITARRLGTFRWVLCGAPSYIENFGEPHTLEDLAAHHFVGYEASRPDILTFEQEGEGVKIDSQSWLTLDETEGYISAGLLGLGLVRAADFLLQDHLAKGRLRQVLPDAEAMETSLYFIRAHSKFSPSALRAFRDWALESLLPL